MDKQTWVIINPAGVEITSVPVGKQSKAELELMGSAFTQACYKVKAKLFETLCEMSVDAYQTSEKTLWKGHGVIAGDGSTLNLPCSEDIEAYFGVQQWHFPNCRRQIR